jgi:hypothetical protein
VVKPRFKHPSVILDHSSLVGVAAPDEATLIVEFSSRAAFSYSQNEWTNSPNMIFVTYTEGCGDYHNGERCYFVAGSIEFDLSTLLVSIQGGAVPLQDVTHDVNVVWGSFDDDGSDASGTFTSSGDTDPGPAPGYDVDTYPSSTSTVEPAFSPAPSCSQVVATRVLLQTLFMDYRPPVWALDLIKLWIVILDPVIPLRSLSTHLWMLLRSNLKKMTTSTTLLTTLRTKTTILSLTMISTLTTTLLLLPAIGRPRAHRSSEARTSPNELSMPVIRDSLVLSGVA